LATKNRYAIPKPEKSPLEAMFALALKEVGCEMVQQYEFHPTRKWKLDFAHPATLVSLEIDGGEFMKKGGGAHNRGVRMAECFEKRNTAILRGWDVFQLTGAMVKKDCMLWARLVRAHIDAKLKENHNATTT